MAFSFSSLTDTLSDLTGALTKKDSNSVLGIDIGTSSIKLVQLKRAKGVAVLETYGEIMLGPYANAEVGQAVNAPTDKVVEALKELVKEANVTATTAGISIPLGSSLISVISLPTVNQNDLASMVPIEARKYIPVPITEVALDWFVIPNEERKYMQPNQPMPSSNPTTDVLMVAIHKGTLSKFTDISKGINVTPQFFEIEPFSFSRASYEHGTQPILMVDFGAAATRVYIIEFGVILISHTINRGGQDITSAIAKSKSLTFGEAETLKRASGFEDEEESGKSVIEFSLAEARRILLAYQRKAGKAVSKIVFVGGGAELRGLDTIARTYFDAPIVHGNAFERVAAPAFITNVLKNAGPTFSSSVGLALRALES